MIEGVDAAFMTQAIALAWTRHGSTGDNPAVGCLIVARDGAVVGQGVTATGGRPHAEEIALKAAGGRARGATAYVTLEPCGARSSGAWSCSDRLADAGVARVVIACEDPSVYAAGRGIRRLKAASVPLTLGVCQAEARALLAGYAPAGQAK